MIRHARSGWTLLLLMIFSFSPAVFAETAQTFKEGVHYKRLAKPQPTIDKSLVEVREFFWYGCPHCYHFEPTLADWLKTKPDQVAFVRTPTVFRKSWEAHAKAFFTAEALGVTDKIHADLFDSYHQKGKKLDNEADLAAFFSERGVDAEKFRKTFSGFFVDMKMRDTKAKPIKYGVTGVPAVVVNGKYLVTGSMAGSYPKMIQVMEYLVEKEKTPGS